ncbi:Hsp70 family protein [Aspergillus melleus]|uniref:Hsp70 family protein n=1 Tax=Aspergillus melleus TaxID=138277 RepID=UPI001E8D970F|nr:uncharacterized protein LDX57_006771 [Aspergillus melleus]KAH8429101.1 hypothetical protein LDX57_006771 [Aspergillus melleus]
MDDNRTIVVAIDFGLTYTGAAFICPSSSRRPDEVVTFNRWPSHNGTKHAPKAPSAVAYPVHNPRAQKRRWGFQIQPGMTASSWMKFFLDDEASNELWALSTGPWERAGGALWIPDNKTPIEVIADLLREVYRCIMRALKDHVAKVTRGNYDGIPVEFWFAVPTTWSEIAKERTIKAAVQAGFDTGLGGYSAEIVLIDEPHAAMTDIIAQASPTTYSIWAGDAILVCDCGGGTTDVVSYYIDEVDPYSYSEISASSGAICGATTVQRALYTLMIERFGDAFIDAPLPLRAPGSLFMANFEECMAKFDGSDQSKAQLPLRMESRGYNPRWYNIRKAEVLLSADDLRGLFNPALSTICNLLSRQMVAAYNLPQRIHINQKIFLVGGFCLSPYVFQAISNRFAVNGATIVYRPDEAQLSMVRGAAIWGSGVLRPATRVSHCHFGVEASMTMDNFYTADYHYLSSLSSGRTATNTITWLVSKGVRYKTDDFEDYPIFLVHKYDDFSTKSCNVYSSTMDAAPVRLDHEGVRLTMPVICDLQKLDLESMPQRNINNCLFYLVECNVHVILGQSDGSIKLEVWAQNQVIGDNGSLNLA